MKKHKTHLFGILLSLALMLGVMSILEMGTPIYADAELVISIEPEGSGTVSITDTSYDDGDYWKMTPSPNEHFAFDYWSFIDENDKPEKSTRNIWESPQRDIAKLSNITAHFRAIVYYDLWVGGTQVTSENLSGDGWSYTPSKDGKPATLTLNGATITKGYIDGSGRTNGIYYDEIYPLTIDLQSGSENLISGVDRCIYSSNYDASLTISGGGTLNASSDSYCGCGILAHNALTINDGTVNVTMTGEEASAIKAESNNGVVTIGEGTVNVSANGANSYGIRTLSADLVVIQNDSKVTASGGEKAIEGKVKNAIAGTGWTDTQGTGDGVRIAKSDEYGQELTYKKVHFPFDHDHNFNYIANGATITATCTETGCPYNNIPATLTIVKPTKEDVYGQGDPNATFSGEIPGVTPIVVYKQGDTVLDSAPTAAGNYTASVTVGGVIASVDYTIEEKYPLYVSGTRVKFTNKDDVLSDDPVNKDKVSYDPADNTLTLNGANITDGYEEVGDEKYGIYYVGSNPLNIKLSSANTIGSDSIHTGIRSDAEVSISGNGKLTISEVVYGVRARGISIKGGEITANTNDSAISAEDECVITAGTINLTAEKWGIAASSVIIGKNAFVTAIGKAKWAIGFNVKNAIAGTGWTDTEGTQGKTAIIVNTDPGQELSDYKKVQFPAKAEPEPKPEPKPTPTPTNVSGALPAKATAKGKTGMTINWNKIQGADGYDIFFAACNKNNKKTACKNVKSISGNNTFKWTNSGLKKGTAYKSYVKAYVMRDGKKTYISTSPVMHAYTGGGNKKYTNAKSVTVKKKKVPLKKGKTYKIKAKVNKLKKSKRLMPKSHAPKLRYLTSDSKVATVSKKGKITAKGSGTCTITVFAHNGVSKSIKVTVP